MLDISLDVICHWISISLACKSGRHKSKAYDTERYAAIKIEVDKLMTTSFIKEVDYPTLLANLVMVKKSNNV